MTGDELKHLLEGLPDVEAPTISVQGERPHLFATVISNSFSGVNEAERQAKVWRYLRDRRPADYLEIEFVFTDAPGESV